MVSSMWAREVTPSMVTFENHSQKIRLMTISTGMTPGIRKKPLTLRLKIKKILLELISGTPITAPSTTTVAISDLGDRDATERDVHTQIKTWEEGLITPDTNEI